MRTHKFLYIIASLALLLTAAGCDETSVNDFLEGAPEIETFSPGSGSIGSDIVITGKYLNNVTAATIGGVDAVIRERVSNSRLTIRVAGEAKSGPIVLSNPLGDGTSDGTFTVTYPDPQANLASIPDEVEMGSNMLISGQTMNVISAVVFTANGAAQGHEATVVSQNVDEVVVKVPYVEDDAATISFRYFDGTTTTTAPATKTITVLRYEPKVSTTSFPVVEPGDVFTLNGEYMDKVNRVLVGGKECSIVQQSSDALQFLVPSSSDYKDGLNVMTLAISYFEGVEQKTVTQNFQVRVPYIYHWTGKTVWGQGRDVDEMTSFFSPETGMAYSNSLWRTVVDPISYKYLNKTCSGKNKPAVTAEEYNSVAPYFFFSGVSAGTLQINSPAGSNSQLKNFYYMNNSADEYRVTGVNASCYGTPCLTFMWLDPSVAAQKALIDQLKNGTMERMDEQTLPINTADKTMAGISLSGLKQSINNSVWAPGVFTVGAEKQADLDSYILVVYYNANGQGSNVSENIKRIGVLHISHVNFKLYNNTKAPSSSSVTFDIYWMKHDYDYSKVR